MFLQEEPITNRRWERSDSDWMILPATAGSYSSFMVIILFLKGRDTGSSVIFLGLIGASLAMYLFNRFPAKVFVGDVGTLGIGATYATAAIIGNIAIFAVIAILPMFFEFFASFSDASMRKGRLRELMHPFNVKSGKLHIPEDCNHPLFSGGASSPTTSQNGGLTASAGDPQPVPCQGFIRHQINQFEWRAIMAG